MILDPTNQFIWHIAAHCDLAGKTVLEVGCGKGRVTLELARHARKVVAVDPDEGLLQAARSLVAAENVEFIRCGGESLAFAEKSFDLVVYSLSLHHIPADYMQESLRQAAKLLRDGGEMIVIEPGDNGTLIEAEERFGVGDGDERTAKEAAQRELRGLGWTVGETIRFRTLFYFDHQLDFLENLLPGHQDKPAQLVREIGAFLDRHRADGRIELDAQRWMNVLRQPGPL